MPPKAANAGSEGTMDRSATPIDPAIRRLQAIAGRVRAAVILERLLLLGASLGGIVLATVLVDAAFRWPTAI
ncbi:MAG: hypothetical protein ACO38P_12290, partial [Phycisphaerales bacterium]